MSLMSLGAVILGGVEGIVLHKILGDLGIVPSTSLWHDISLRDIVVLIIGLIQSLFGGRIHSAVRLMGYGVVAWQIGHEAAQFIWT